VTAWWVTGDTRDVTAMIPDGSIDLILTSPPFLALRSYLPADHVDKHREIGSEATPAAFVDMLLELSAEWRRVLSPTGSLMVELGDTYSSEGTSKPMTFANRPGGVGAPELPGGKSRYELTSGRTSARTGAWPLDKSLCLIPELYRIGLVYGINPLTGQPSPAGRFRARNVVRWVRPNPPVGALGDKFRPATSDLVVACMARDRWFDLDAVRSPVSEWEQKYADGYGNPRTGKSGNNPARRDGGRSANEGYRHPPAGAPPLDWWQIVPGGFTGAHYAVFPPELCIKPIEAMCPRRVCRTCGAPSRRQTGEATYVNSRNGKAVTTLHFREGEHRDGQGNTVDSAGLGDRAATRQAPTTGWSTCGCPETDGLRLDGSHTGLGWRPGIVYDPFAGSGTVAAVASGHGRDSIGVDIDDRNAHLARERVGMFLDEVSAPALACLLTGTQIGDAA
jgi:hypothetical protein